MPRALQILSSLILTTTWELGVIISFYRWGNQLKEGLSDLPRIIQLIAVSGHIWAQVFLTRLSALFTTPASCGKWEVLLGACLHLLANRISERKVSLEKIRWVKKTKLEKIIRGAMLLYNLSSLFLLLSGSEYYRSRVKWPKQPYSPNQWGNWGHGG